MGWGEVRGRVATNEATIAKKNRKRTWNFNNTNEAVVPDSVAMATMPLN